MSFMKKSEGLLYLGQGNPYIPKYLSDSCAGPWKMMFPRTMSNNRSNLAKISEEGWWMLLTMVRPELAKVVRRSMTWSAVAESSPLICRGGYLWSVHQERVDWGQ